MIFSIPGADDSYCRFCILTEIETGNFIFSLFMLNT